MSWKDILKMERFRYSVFKEAPIKEEYKDDFPPLSIMNKGLKMLKDKLEKLHEKAEISDWKTGEDKMWAYVDTPKITINVLFQRYFGTDYMRIRISQNPIRYATKDMNHDVYVIIKEVLKFYESNSTMKVSTSAGASPHTWFYNQERLQ